MAEEIKAKKILLPALRQHQHNDCSGLIPAYDYDEANRIMAEVLNRLANPVENRVMPKIAEALTKEDIEFLERCNFFLNYEYSGKAQKNVPSAFQILTHNDRGAYMDLETIKHLVSVLIKHISNFTA